MEKSAHLAQRLKNKDLNSLEPRNTSRGFRTVLVVVYSIFAISATARSMVQILRDFDKAPVAYSLSLFAALTYVLLAILMSRQNPPRLFTLIVVAIELSGVVLVGILSLSMPNLFPDATVWSLFGVGYGFAPLLLPLIAAITILKSK